MITSIFDSSTLPMLEQVVNFTQARHGVLAGNIANIDTPGYRTRDLSPELFQQRLKDAVESSHASRSSTQGLSRADRPGQNKYDAYRDVKEATKSILFHDGSDVSIEKQVTELAKNQGQHNLAISLLTSQYRLLRAAVTERVA